MSSDPPTGSGPSVEPQSGDEGYVFPWHIHDAENPFRLLAELIDDLLDLADPESSCKPNRFMLVGVGHRFDVALDDARQLGAVAGVPFVAVDDALTEANKRFMDVWNCGIPHARRPLTDEESKAADAAVRELWAFRVADRLWELAASTDHAWTLHRAEIRHLDAEATGASGERPDEAPAATDAERPSAAGRRRHPEALVERVRKLRGEGLSWKEVARVVNDEFPRPGSPWTADAVRELLKPRRK